MDFSRIPSPCFVLDEARLRANCELMKHVQEEAGVKIILALKGFALFHAFPLIRDYLPGTTASSLYEARLGHEEFGGEVHACAPIYAARDMEEMLGYLSHITFNSLSQWEQYKPQVLARRDVLSAAIRINPEYAEVSTALYNPGMPGSRLGVPADELGEHLPDGIEGLHMHTLCECGADALERTLEVVEAKFAPLLHEAKWLNLGGGHLMTRAGYEVDRLIALLKSFRKRFELELILEPGSAVGWDTGVLAATIMDRFERRGVKTLMLDTSFSAHMPDCLEMPYKPRVRGARDPQAGEQGWRLGGMTCLAGDFLGDYIFEREPQVGDRIVFEDMMHYTMVKTTMFNGVAHPGIGIWRESGRFDLVREFGYADYRNRMG
jgi:carboxynorspermidine decarboxylase